MTHGYGVVENSISIGPLSLKSSLRLFARLCPSLLTAKEKSDFVRSLLIKDQGEVTLESREVSSPMTSHYLSIYPSTYSYICLGKCTNSTDIIYAWWWTSRTDCKNFM